MKTKREVSTHPLVRRTDAGEKEVFK